MNYFKVMFEYKQNGNLTQKHVVVSSENRFISDEINGYFENNIEYDTDYRANRIIINATSELDFERHPEFMKLSF